MAFATLGCKVNRYDRFALRALLGAAIEEVPFGQPADATVVHTCTVTATTDHKSRQLIYRGRRASPSGLLLVTGCLAQVRPSEIAALGGVDGIFGTDCAAELVQHVLDRSPARPQPPGTRWPATPPASLWPATPAMSSLSRPLLKVQDGCDACCAYCILPLARGRPRSRPFASTLAELRGLGAALHAEVVLTGIHLGAYGHDLEPATDLATLVQAVEVEQPLPRLRLSSLEPLELDPRLVEAAADGRLLCPHFHLPLQSGDDDILRAMNRPYRAGDFAERVWALHRRCPDAAIGSDLIVGFPGESQLQFEHTLAFVSSLPLAYLHVFPFSPRPGTPAAGLLGRVPPPEIARRAAALRALASSKRQAFAERFVGSWLEVLVEARRDLDTGLACGLSRNYLTVLLPGRPPPPGQLLPVRGQAACRGRLLAAPA